MVTTPKKAKYVTNRLQIPQKKKKYLRISKKSSNFVDEKKTQTMHTILIIDDERDIREILSFNLEQADYTCLQATNGQQGLAILTEQKVNLILLDVMMPGMSGFELAQMIRNDEVPGVAYDTPIIFLTALGEENDILRGFSLGADDYISKPFRILEVLARVEAVLRRQTSPNLPSHVGIPHLKEDEEGLLLDDQTYTATIHGEDIDLTKMEYELLHFLTHHPGVVYSRGELLTQVWPDNGLVLDRTVDVTVTRLRKKIGIYKDQLKTKTGYGYYWEK